MYYLIKRGPEKKYDQKPFHPIIICDRKKVMQTQVIWSGGHDWVWTANLWAVQAGWMLERWNGLIIEYGHVIRSFELPDGTWTGYHRPYELSEYQKRHSKDSNIKALFVDAIWWSDKRMPSKFSELGVVYPTDEVTRQRVLEDCTDDGLRGVHRTAPEFWTKAIAETAEAVKRED